MKRLHFVFRVGMIPLGWRDLVSEGTAPYKSESGLKSADTSITSFPVHTIGELAYLVQLRLNPGQNCVGGAGTVHGSCLGEGSEDHKRV